MKISDTFIMKVSMRGSLIVFIERKYLLAFRITTILISLPFLHDIYIVLATNVADSGRYIAERGEDWGYYAYLFKKFAFAFLFLWLGTFGSRDKSLSKNDS